MATKPYPFLRWAGGKRWLVPEIERLFLSGSYTRYIEPFLGGGAVFFGLAPSDALLADINPELINAFRQVKYHSEELLTELKKVPVDRDTYESVRSWRPRKPMRRAIRFLYLNRTAYSGIYRINSQGKYNVPYGGGSRTTSVLWERNLLTQASTALQNARLRSQDFVCTVREAKEGDFVYCDPTYTVKHNNNGFVRYNEPIFAWSDQERLAKACRRAVDRGAVVVVSNAAHEEVASLYPGFKASVLERYSCLAPNASQRKRVQEYVLTSG